MFNLVAAVAVYCIGSSPLLDSCKEVLNECVDRKVWSYVEMVDYEPSMLKYAFNECSKNIEWLHEDTPGEGWYSFEIDNRRLLKWNMCGDKKDTPKCKLIGSRGEGWYLGDKLEKYDQCEYKQINCEAIGTRSEGWYTYNKINYTFLK